jgi:hypothetical protein
MSGEPTASDPPIGKTSAGEGEGSWEERLAITLAGKIQPADPEADLAYWREREEQERARAAASSCMARTAHEDLADDYADKIKQAAEVKPEQR